MTDRASLVVGCWCRQEDFVKTGYMRDARAVIFRNMVCFSTPTMHFAGPVL